MARSHDGLTDMDWDKLKVFHAAAEAGSFTHAGEQLGLSQSAVSRQVSALEQELSVSLFHRHARGLILTEQGDLLFRTAHDVFMQLQAARAKLTDSRERPSGELKVTTSPGLGINWLVPRLTEFTSLYPEIRLALTLTDEELDLSMREADVLSDRELNVLSYLIDTKDVAERRLYPPAFLTAGKLDESLDIITECYAVYEKLKADMSTGAGKRRPVRGILETIWDKAIGNKNYLLKK